MNAPVEADRIIVPGRCRGDLDALTAHYGIPVVRGPEELKDIPQFFDRAAKAVDLSRHDITVGDGMTAATNGCLYCHDVSWDTGGKYIVAYGGTKYERPALSLRQDLWEYDAFCLDCHDGSGTDFGSLVPPQVDVYLRTAGHGKQSGTYNSNNVAANIPCLECHLYHGSTAYKLLPGAVPTYAYPAKTDEERAKLRPAVSRILSSKEDVVIVCPGGGSGAKNTYDFLKAQGVPEDRMRIL